MNDLHKQDRQIAVIAGPCSISGPHYPEMYAIQNEFFAKLKNDVTGFRVVGYKSRTAPDKEGILEKLYGYSNDELLNLRRINPDLNANAKNYYGLDVCEVMVSQRMIFAGTPIGSKDLPNLPSVMRARDFQKKYPHLLIATEIIEPFVQIPQLKRHLRPGSVLAWTPANDVLGPSKTIYRDLMVEENFVAIKNPKWLGIDPALVTEENILSLSGIKTMLGCMQWANTNIMIHRGFELEEKEGHRAKPVHEVFDYLKKRVPELSILFDPSHSFGPNYQPEIKKQSVKAVEKHGYHGLLIEASTATTDAAQHVSTDEMLEIVGTLKQRGYKIKTYPIG